MEGFDELDEGEKRSLAKNFYMLIHASVVSTSHLCCKDRHQTGARIRFFFFFISMEMNMSVFGRIFYRIFYVVSLPKDVIEHTHHPNLL